MSTSNSTPVSQPQGAGAHNATAHQHDPVHFAQSVFRTALDALANPGQPLQLDVTVDFQPALGAPATALCLALLDFETPIWVPEHPSRSALVQHLRFACGASVVSHTAEASMAIVPQGAALPHLESFALGTDEQPERGATLIIAVEGFAPGVGTYWSGPGLAKPLQLDVRGLSADFWDQRSLLRELFPRGLDIYFASGTHLVGLPRSTRLER